MKSVILLALFVEPNWTAQLISSNGNFDKVATLWSVSAIGILCGAGRFREAFMVALLAWVTLRLIRWRERHQEPHEQ